MSKSKNFLCILMLLSYLVCVCRANADSNSYEDALQDYTAGEIDSAYIHLKNALQADIHNLPAKLLMGKVLLAKGLYSDAVLEFEDALSMNADANLVLEFLAKAQLLSGRNADLVDLDESRLSNPSSKIELRLLKAAAYRNLGEAETAINLYNDILSQRPKEIRALNNLASLLLDNGQVSRAEQLLNKAYEVDPNDNRVWHLKGVLQARNNNLDLAIQFFDKALQINAFDPVAKRALASALVNKGDFDRALGIVTDIVAATPDDPYALMMQSRLLLQKEEYELAQQVLEELSVNLKAIEEQKLTDRISFSLISGMTYYMTGEYEQALTHLVAYKKEVKDNLNADIILANTYIALQQERKALSVLETLEGDLVDHLPTALLLCQLYLQNNKSFKAVALLDILKEKYPNNSKLVLMEAKVSVSRGRQDHAIEEIENFLLANDDAELNLFLGLILSQSGQLEKAENVAQHLVKLEPENSDFRNFYASVLILRSNFSMARKILDEILRQFPDHFAANFNMATIYANEQNFDEATTILTSLEGRRDNYLPFELLSAKIYANQNDFGKAIEKLEKITTLWPENSEAQDLLITTYLESDQQEKALTMLSRLLHKNSMNDKYIAKKAEIYLDLEEIPAAIDELKLLKGLWSESAIKSYQLSKLFIQAKEFKEAENSLIRAIQISENNATLKLELARLLLRQGEIDRAKKHIDDVLTTQKENPDAWLLKGDVAKMQGDSRASYKHYAKSYELNDALDLALIRLYQLSLKGIGVESFSKKVEQVLAKNPQRHFQRRLLADHYLHYQKTEKSYFHYEILLDTDNVVGKNEIYNNLAVLYLESDLEKAEEYINYSLTLEGDSWSALDTKGWILAKKGQYQDALLMLRQAYSRNSDSAAVRYHLAYVLAKLNRYDEAKKELELALASEQKFSERAEAEKLFESI